jgi:hypothetical protein
MAGPTLPVTRLAAGLLRSRAFAQQHPAVTQGPPRRNPHTSDYGIDRHGRGGRELLNSTAFQVFADGLTNGQPVGTADGANNCPHSWRAAD